MHAYIDGCGINGEQMADGIGVGLSCTFILSNHNFIIFACLCLSPYIIVNTEPENRFEYEGDVSRRLSRTTGS